MIPSVDQILSPLIGDVVIPALELPVDNLGVGKFGVGFLGRLGSVLVLFTDVFILCIAMEGGG